MALEFSLKILENPQISHFMKFRPLVADCLMWTDRGMDKRKEGRTDERTDGRTDRQTDRQDISKLLFDFAILRMAEKTQKPL
jgi:hypothetical protein